ncbi:hypothetical protein [Kribbella sp. NPDC048915]|uniref:hypothetical protein n=1 Tax=Kribbella sp. NPDC048915 TaxID=3155148 RepID=UPI0033F6379A
MGALHALARAVRGGGKLATAADEVPIDPGLPVGDRAPDLIVLESTRPQGAP